MASLATLARQTGQRPDHLCGVCHAIDTIDKPMSAHLTKALSNPAVRNVEIGSALALEGFDIGAHTISRHRRNLCAGGRGLKVVGA